jgi:hypothetical protein
VHRRRLRYKWSPASGDVTFLSPRIPVHLGATVHLPLGLFASIKRHIYGHGLSYGEKGHGGGKYSFAIVALLTTYMFVPSHFRRTTAQVQY